MHLQNVAQNNYTSFISNIKFPFSRLEYVALKDIIAKQKGCYCAEDIVESTPVVICRDCDRKMHSKCTNSA